MDIRMSIARLSPTRCHIMTYAIVDAPALDIPGLSYIFPRRDPLT